MEINILKEEKGTMEFEITGEGHTFCNLLRVELWESVDTSLASYNVKHPLVGTPVFAVSLKKGKPKKALLDAVDSLKAKIKEMRALAKDLN